MKKFLIVTMLFAAFCTSPAMAGEWRIDDNHSQAVFTIEHIVGKVTGFFNSFRFGDRDMQSTVRFDPDSPENGACEIVINTWTIDTGIERRDKHLSTSDFFDCRNFPVIVFKSDDISRLDDGTYEAAGKLTIKDVTKSVVVPFTFLGSETHPDPNMKKNKGAIEARINLNRLDYNVGSGKFSKMGLVGEGVCLTVYLEMFAE